MREADGAGPPRANRRALRLGRLLLLILTPLGAPGPVHAADDAAAPANLLAKMSLAVRGLNYQGSFIYEHDGQIDALRLFHAGDGAEERERLISLSGARSEAVRSGGSVACLPAGSPAVLFPNRDGARLLPLVPETRNAALRSFYAFAADGTDRVAGYGARIVDIVPRDAYRYGYRIWLESDSALPLRSAVVDASKRVLEQFAFVDLEIGARPREGDLAAGAGAAAGVPPDEIPLGRATRWRVVDPPPGFHFLYSQRAAQGAAQAEHQMLSDGLADVSVYVEPRDAREPAQPDRATQKGVLSVYARDTDGFRITVLGGVPRATVERIARSLQPISP